MTEKCIMRVTHGTLKFNLLSIILLLSTHLCEIKIYIVIKIYYSIFRNNSIIQTNIKLAKILGPNCRFSEVESNDVLFCP